MLKYELKKLFAKRTSRAVLIFILLAAFLFNLFAIKSVPYFTGDGNPDTSPGAVRSLTREKNKWKGELTPQVLEKAAAENQSLRRQYGDSIPDDRYAEVLQPAGDILGMLEQIREDGAGSVGPETAKQFYQLRQEKLAARAKENGETAAQREFLEKQYAKAETPFYYEGTDSWEIMTRYAEFYGIILALAVGFLSAGIFSDEFRLQADSIFFASRHGRSRASGNKLRAGLLTATAVYWGGMLVFSIMGFAVMGTSGGGVPVQIKWAESLYPITFRQEYLLTLFCGYTASLLSAAVTMLISAKRHGSGIAVCAPFILFCVSPFLARTLNMDAFTNVIPQRLFYIDNIMGKPVFFQIGDAVIRQIPFVLILYLAVSLVCLPLIYGACHRYTMK